MTDADDDAISLAHFMATMLGYSWMAMEDGLPATSAKALTQDDFINLAAHVLEMQKSPSTD